MDAWEALLRAAWEERTKEALDEEASQEAEYETTYRHDTEDLADTQASKQRELTVAFNAATLEVSQMKSAAVAQRVATMQMLAQSEQKLGRRFDRPTGPINVEAAFTQLACLHNLIQDQHTAQLNQPLQHTTASFS